MSRSSERTLLILPNLGKAGRRRKKREFRNPNGDGNKAVPVEWKPATKDSPERHLRIDKESETCDSFFVGMPNYIRNGSI